jgi:hypothetical protein
MIMALAADAGFPTFPARFLQSGPETKAWTPLQKHESHPAYLASSTKRLYGASQSGQENSKPKPRFNQNRAAGIARCLSPTRPPAGLPPERRISSPRTDHRPKAFASGSTGAPGPTMGHCRDLYH